MLANNTFIFLTVTLVLIFNVSAASYIKSEPENHHGKSEIISHNLRDGKKDSASNRYEEEKSILTGLVGDRAHINKYPYTVAAIARTSHEGSGIILNKKWILTSGLVAMYEDPKRFLVRAGSDLAIDKGQTVWPSEIIVHPNYKLTWAFNVALIKLKKPLKFTKKVKAIKLATSTPANGTKASLVGFGCASQNSKNHRRKSNDIINMKNTYYAHDGWLRAGTFEVLSYKDCKGYYSQELYPSFTSISFCTVPKTDSGPCYYDYGSPLVVNKQVVGLYSGVPACLQSKYPPVYTDVIQFKTWIEDTIKKNSDSKELREFETETEYYE